MVKILFLGDLILDYFDTKEKTSVFEHELTIQTSGSVQDPYTNLYSLLQSADLVVTNLETVTSLIICSGSEQLNKAHLLKLGQKTFYSLANDHILDRGVQGLEETIETLDNLGIYYGGAGSNMAEASAITRLEINSLKIGLLACSNHPSFWVAQRDQAGIFYVNPSEPQQLLNYISHLKPYFDILILSMYLGPNHISSDQSDPWCSKFVQGVKEAGIDIFQGHSGKGRGEQDGLGLIINQFEVRTNPLAFERKVYLQVTNHQFSSVSFNN